MPVVWPRRYFCSPSDALQDVVAETVQAPIPVVHGSQVKIVDRHGLQAESMLEVTVVDAEVDQLLSSDAGIGQVVTLLVLRVVHLELGDIQFLACKW